MTIPTYLTTVILLVLIGLIRILLSSDYNHSTPLLDLRLHSDMFQNGLFGSMAMQASQLAMETTLAPGNVQCDACK